MWILLEYKCTKPNYIGKSIEIYIICYIAIIIAQASDNLEKIIDKIKMTINKIPNNINEYQKVLQMFTKVNLDLLSKPIYFIPLEYKYTNRHSKTFFLNFFQPKNLQQQVW